jgi:hypothetical protein
MLKGHAHVVEESYTQINIWPFGDWKFGEELWFENHHMMQQ